MADYENGLPPAGTDVTDSNINAVSVVKSEFTADEEAQISSISIVKSLDDSVVDNAQISSISFSKEDVGKVLFAGFL